MALARSGRWNQWGQNQSPFRDEDAAGLLGGLFGRGKATRDVNRQWDPDLGHQLWGQPLTQGWTDQGGMAGLAQPLMGQAWGQQSQFPSAIAGAVSQIGALNEGNRVASQNNRDLRLGVDRYNSDLRESQRRYDDQSRLAREQLAASERLADRDWTGRQNLLSTLTRGPGAQQQSYEMVGDPSGNPVPVPSQFVAGGQLLPGAGQGPRPPLPGAPGPVGAGAPLPAQTNRARDTAATGGFPGFASQIDPTAFRAPVADWSGVESASSNLYGSILPRLSDMALNVPETPQGFDYSDPAGAFGHARLTGGSPNAPVPGGSVEAGIGLPENPLGNAGEALSRMRSTTAQTLPQLTAGAKGGAKEGLASALADFTRGTESGLGTVLNRGYGRGNLEMNLKSQEAGAEGRNLLWKLLTQLYRTGSSGELNDLGLQGDMLSRLSRIS